MTFCNKRKLFTNNALQKHFYTCGSVLLCDFSSFWKGDQRKPLKYVQLAVSTLELALILAPCRRGTGIGGAALSDMWVLRHGEWSELPPAGGAPTDVFAPFFARTRMSAVGLPLSTEVLLFGGLDGYGEFRSTVDLVSPPVCATGELGRRFHPRSHPHPRPRPH